MPIIVVIIVIIIAVVFFNAAMNVIVPIANVDVYLIR